MKALSNFNLTILLSAFVVLPICNSTGNIITSSATTATPTYQEAVLASFAGGNDGAYPTAKLIKGSDGNFYGTTYQTGTNNFGNVFRITPQGVKTIIYSFKGGNDGLFPNGLIQGSDGNLYGTTAGGGGGGGYGTVFKITPSGVETILYSFTGSTDGANPYAGLIQANDGNFYGTTTYGGIGYGTVFRITSSGVKTTLYNFTGGTDGANPNAGLIQASDGNLYGTTYQGGNNGVGTVFKVTPQGQERVLYSFADGQDGANPYAGLIQASDGNFYGTTYQGGNNGVGTVFKITLQGQETTLYNFTDGNDGANPYAELIQASDGNFYGTTQDGGSGYGTVFKITTQGVETTLYSFTGGIDGGTPYAGLIQGSDGNFYGTTQDGGTANLGTVFKIYQ